MLGSPIETRRYRGKAMPWPLKVRLDANHISGKDWDCHVPISSPGFRDTGPPPRRVFVYLGFEFSG
jgi:hypothetical protein